MSPPNPHFFYLFFTNPWPMPATHIFLFTPMIFYQSTANARCPHFLFVFLPIYGKCPSPTFLFLFQQSTAHACLTPTTSQYHSPHPYLPTWGSPTLHVPGGFLTQPAVSATLCFAAAWAQLLCPSLNSRVISLVHWTRLQWVKTMFCLSISNGIIGLTYVSMQLKSAANGHGGVSHGHFHSVQSHSQLYVDLVG